MSYDAYITRDTSYPFLASEPPETETGVSLHDWTLAVSSDSELTPIDEHAAHWTGHALPFVYYADKQAIRHCDPKPNVIEKMLALATPLNAVVRGGDGEIYTSGNEFDWPDDPDFHVQTGNVGEPKLLAYVPVVIGLIATLTVHWLFDALLITLATGVAAPVITFLILAVPSLWQRAA